ncbi:hypothetical protein H920_11504 [Fukomys damarensis]|uniref:Uncharacterized protein n=1 Tax=Fukomys damarensis TaxID=885580 RepID=A0A091D4S7_FUKDA|nr:hypothetical protein H920_11504 [Fukomys damarensis]
MFHGGDGSEDEDGEKAPESPGGHHGEASPGLLHPCKSLCSGSVPAGMDENLAGRPWPVGWCWAPSVGVCISSTLASCNPDPQASLDPGLRTPPLCSTPRAAWPRLCPGGGPGVRLLARPELDVALYGSRYESHHFEETLP